MPDLQAQDRAVLRDLTANLNDRHRNAQFAGRASSELHTLIFFSKQAIAADARIVKVILHAVLSCCCWQPHAVYTMPALLSRMPVTLTFCVTVVFACILASKVLQGCWLLAMLMRKQQPRQRTDGIPQCTLIGPLRSHRLGCHTNGCRAAGARH
jgi:hypothetical protein